MDRLDSKEESLFIELFEGGIGEGFFLFGRYLRAKGLVTDEDIFNARMLQKTQNRRIGEVAIELGLMDDEAVERLLVIQEEMGVRFGDLAIKFGYLTDEQLDDIIKKMDRVYLYFGEALVKLGAIRQNTMLENLGIFQRLKVRIQDMDA